MHQRVWWIWVVWSLAGLWSRAQIEVLPIETYSTERGLSQAIVWSVIEDGRGFIWVGTSNGLNRYDGYEFLSFGDGTGEDSLPGHEIRALLPASEHEIWVGTSKGLALLDTVKGRCRRFQLPDGKPFGAYVTALEASNDGGIWIGTRSGLFRLDSRDGVVRVSELGMGPSESKTTIRSLCIESRTILWVGTHDGLFRVNVPLGTAESFQHDPNNEKSISHNTVRALYRDGSGRLWAGTSSGLNRFDAEHKAFDRFYYRRRSDDIVPGDWINVITGTPDGSMWIGTRSGGLARVEMATKRMEVYRAREGGLASDNILSLCFGRSELMWIGSFKLGLARLDLKSSKFRRFLLARVGDNRSDHVQTILRDSSGGLWLGNSDGVIYHHAG